MGSYCSTSLYVCLLFSKSRNTITAEPSQLFASSCLPLPSCSCFVLICIHNKVVSSCSALPGTRRPPSDLPRRKGSVCRYRAKFWPSAPILVGQTEPSRGSACLLNQVSVGCALSNDPLCPVLQWVTAPVVPVSAGMPSRCGILTQTSEPEQKKST